MKNKLRLQLGSMSAGSDLYYEPFRWDQKFVTFLVKSSCEQKDLRIQEEILALVEATGGEMIVSDNLESTLGKIMLV